VNSFVRKTRAFTGSFYALMLAYRAEIYLWVLAMVLPFIMMAVWSTAAQGGGLSKDPVGYARYFLAVFIVRNFSVVWMIYDFEWHVVEGRLSIHLLRPASPLWHYVTAHIAEQMARAPFFAVIVILFFCIFPQAIWVPTPFAIVGGVVCIYFAFALRFVLQWCFAMLSFWYERAASIEQLQMLPYYFLGGFVAPLSDFPEPVRKFAELTPFPYVVNFPARILIGEITLQSPEFHRGLLIMAAWFAGLFVLASILWRRGLKHYSGQGA